VKLIRVLLLLLAAGVAPADDVVSIDSMQGLGDTRHHVITSKTLNKDYHILVGLPDGYDASGDTSYPTIYLLDGGTLYPLFASYTRLLRFAGDVPDYILVGISYGTDDWQQGNDRSHDYTAPTDEREFWGGAEDFRKFLDGELLPLIESKYSSDSNRRVIFGRSLGGQFVLFTAQTQPDLFWGHIASNPALHRNLPLFLSLKPERPDTESHLFVSSAENDDPVFREPAMKWIEHWSNAEDLPWRLHVETLDDHNHFSTPAAAFRRGLGWLFPD
jgi:predicted alpha/beta superfamily hydrolase